MNRVSGRLSVGGKIHALHHAGNRGNVAGAQRSLNEYRKPSALFYGTVGDPGKHECFLAEQFR